MNRHFLQKETHRAKQLMNNFLISVVTREMQTKGAMTYLYSFNWQKLKRQIILLEVMHLHVFFLTEVKLTHNILSVADVSYNN